MNKSFLPYLSDIFQAAGKRSNPLQPKTTIQFLSLTNLFVLSEIMSNQGDCVSSSTSSILASNSTFVSTPAATAANGPDSNSSNLWPAYFVERPDGTITALIEVDQLPDSIRIRGLPPKLSASETTGMTSVGVKKESQRKYCIETADIPGKFCFSDLSEHKTHGNTSATPPTTLSSKTPVGQSPFEKLAGLLANYTVERRGDRFANPRPSHDCRGVFLDQNWSKTTSRGC